MCAFRKVLGRHLTELGVVASPLRGNISHPPIPLLYRPPRKASLSRPLFWPKSSSRRLNQNQDHSKGQFYLNQRTLAPVPGQVSPSGSLRLGSSVLRESGIGLCYAAAWREGCTCIWSWHALLQPHQATGTPAAPRALRFLLEIVINNAARVAGHGKALFSSVGEAIGISK